MPLLPTREPAEDGAGTLVIETGVIPKRVRRPTDVLRLIAAIIAMALIVTVTYFLTSTSAGVQADIIEAGQQLPGFLKVAVTIMSGLGVFLLPVAIAIDLLIRRRGRQLLDALLAFLGAAALAGVLSYLITTYGSTQLIVALTGLTARDGRVPLDGVMAGLVAFVTVARLVGRGRWGLVATLVLGAVGLAPLVAGSASATTIALSILLGWAVGLFTRWAAGTPTTRPSGWDLAATLERSGFPLTVLRASRETSRGRAYDATTATGARLRLIVLDRDLEGAGVIAAVWRQLRLRADSNSGGGFSMRSQLDHAALMSYAAQVGGAPTPRLVLVTEVGPDAAVLAYENIEGKTFAEIDAAEITDADVEGAFRGVRALHRDRIAHRSLSAGQLLRDEHGEIWVAGIQHGVVAASDLQERLDLAELLVTLSLLVGSERSLAAGARVLGSPRLLRALPTLQKVALSRETRQALRGHKKLLGELRDGLVAQLPDDGEIEQIELRRIKPRTIATIVAGLIAAFVVAGQLANVDLVTLITTASWQWSLAALFLSFLSFVGAALSLSGFVPEKLSHIRTFAAQLAAAFATLVSPPTIGAVAVNVRYLQKSGLHPALASASVGVSQVFAFFIHICLLFGFGIAAGTQEDLSFTPPRIAVIAVAAVLVILALLLTFGPVRKILLERARPILTEVGPRLATLAQRPWKILEGIGGILLLNMAFCACLIASVEAFGGQANLSAIAIVYLAGSTLGQAAPTPGGLGAVEAAYIAGLTAAGVDPSIAVSATLLFRIVTFWLPTIPGYLSLNWLQKVGSL